MLATGKYQFVNTSDAPTLSSLANAARIDVRTLYDQTTQERLVEYFLLENLSRVGNYLKGTNAGTQAELEAAVQALSSAFASMPVISKTKQGTGTFGDVRSGAGSVAYYGGVGVNRAVAAATVGKVVKALIQSRVAYSKKSPVFVPTYAV